ncbi:MAG: carboxymuconolactone decarboxylase family protein [Desulfopila sp.]
MTEKKKNSGTFGEFSTNYPEVMQAVSNLGAAVRSAGPLDAKTSHLIQLAAAAANNAEGAVHSHVRRAIEAGATPEEVYHAAVLLIPTCGFPRAMATVSWCRDMIDKKTA